MQYEWFFHQTGLITDNITCVFAIPNLYLYYFTEIPSLLRFSLGRQKTTQYLNAALAINAVLFKCEKQIAAKPHTNRAMFHDFLYFNTSCLRFRNSKQIISGSSSHLFCVWIFYDTQHACTDAHKQIHNFIHFVLFIIVIIHTYMTLMLYPLRGFGKRLFYTMLWYDDAA
jgi:hypothetical protein